MLKSMHSQYDTIWTSRNPKEDALFYDRLSGGTHNPKGGHGGEPLVLGLVSGRQRVLGYNVQQDNFWEDT